MVFSEEHVHEGCPLCPPEVYVVCHEDECEWPPEYRPCEDHEEEYRTDQRSYLDREGE